MAVLELMVVVLELKDSGFGDLGWRFSRLMRAVLEAEGDDFANVEARLIKAQS
jgi:hypothetical protein